MSAVEVQPPAVVLEAAQAGVDGGALVEVAAVLGEEIGLDADGAVLLRDLLGAAVVVAGDDDHGVEVGMVERQGEVEQVVEADADGDGFEAEGFEGKFGGEGVVQGEVEIEVVIVTKDQAASCHSGLGRQFW